MAYARHVTDTSAAQAHPYDPSLRREHWRRILSESPLPSAELVEGWFYRTGSKNDHPLDHNAAAILVEHMAQRITSALSFSSSSSRLSSSSLAGVKYEDLSVGDDEGDPVRDQALRCAPARSRTRSLTFSWVLNFQFPNFPKSKPKPLGGCTVMMKST